MPRPSTATTRDPQSFDHLAARYDRFSALVGRDLDAWVSFHLPARPTRALDLGCGTGVHTARLADRCMEVLAADLSASMVAHARRYRGRANVIYDVRDFYDVTPAADGPFDVVLCGYVLHHLPDLRAAFRHLTSLVRPGGVLLVADVVDARGHVPRAWLLRRALRTFAADLAHGRRRYSEARDLLRLQLDSDWLAHQTTDDLVPPAVWREVAARELDGATFVEFDRALGAAWKAPGSPWERRP